jgi:hypothetical protein
MAKIAIEELDTSSSILFLGSGFSRDATNIAGTTLPIGDGLMKALANEIKADPDQYDLRTLADEAASMQDFSLYDFLYHIYTVKPLQNNQIVILSRTWLRIYTTNYDDAVELAHHTRYGRFESFNYDEPRPNKLHDNSIVHLHGCIRSMTHDDLLDQLALNERSYVRQHFERSLWYDEFIRDMRFCSLCFFVGYSLSDYHITSLLLQNPATTKKTFFVTQENPTTIFINRVAPYGTVLPIGVGGFADLCGSLPRPPQPKILRSLRNFRYIDPFKIKGHWNHQQQLKS